MPEGPDGLTDRKALAAALLAYSGAALLVGSFSAASNVTGLVEPVDELTEQLHLGGAIALWDYASGASGLPIDMNPPPLPGAAARAPPGMKPAALKHLARKDAVFLSPHKLPGGPGACGVLVATRALFRNSVPSVPGGGTVFFVTDRKHRYLGDIEEREEGGTPNILGALRAALALKVPTRPSSSALHALTPFSSARSHPPSLFACVDRKPISGGGAARCATHGALRDARTRMRMRYFPPPQVKHSISDATLEHAEERVAARLFAGMNAIPGVGLLGPDYRHHSHLRRLPIASFVVRASAPGCVGGAQDGRQNPGSFGLLHHNFVCALLNDLYGVQARPRPSAPIG